MGLPIFVRGVFLLYVALCLKQKSEATPSVVSEVLISTGPTGEQAAFEDGSVNSQMDSKERDLKYLEKKLSDLITVNSAFAIVYEEFQKILKEEKNVMVGSLQEEVGEGTISSEQHTLPAGVKMVVSQKEEAEGEILPAAVKILHKRGAEVWMEKKRRQSRGRKVANAKKQERNIKFRKGKDAKRKDRMQHKQQLPWGPVFHIFTLASTSVMPVTSLLSRQVNTITIACSIMQYHTCEA